MKTYSIKVNAILNIIYTISNMIFPLITFPYVSRILLADGMGKVSFFTAVSNYAVMIASLGISTYGIRAIAKVRNNKKELSKVTAELLFINIVMTCIVIVILLSSINFITKFSDNKQLLFINLILIFSSAIGMNWFYSGLEQYAYITKRSIAFKTLSLVLVFLFVHQKSDYVIYAAITAFSMIGSHVVNFIYARRFISLKNVGALNIRKHIRPMLLLFASILAVNIYTNLDTVMLGFISSDREVGLYTVAVKVKSLLLAIVNAISVVLLPRLSFYLSENRIDGFNKILKKSISLILMISIPLVIFFNIEADDSILLLGGSDYVEAKLCMQIVMPILIISGISNIAGNQILIPFGKDSFFMTAVVIGSIIDLILNAFLMPKYGAIGAAVATLTAELTQMLIQVKYAWSYINKNFQKDSIIKSITSASLSGLGVLLIKNIVTISRFSLTINLLFSLIFNSFCFFALYGFLLFIMKEQYFRQILFELSSRFKILKSRVKFRG